MTPVLVPLILLSVISLLGVISSTILTLRLRKLTRLLKIQEAEEECSETGEATGGFAPVLRRTDLHVRLHQGWKLREIPEKYRFIRSLADYGVPAAEIAGILNLASGEVDQLMSLNRVARRQSPDPKKDLSPKKACTSFKAKDFSPFAEMII